MKKYISLHYTTLFLFLVVFSIGFGQNSGPNPDKIENNERYFDFQDTFKDSLVFWQERVVLHVANEYVSNDKLLFFKAYLLTGVQQNRFGLSNVLNLELLGQNGTVIKRQSHKITDGMVEGQVELPKDIVPGKYYLRAYTRWMQNYGEDFFAQKDILVGMSSSDIENIGNNSDILILPEGGTLLNDHDNRLIIKIPHLQASKAGKVARILDDKKNEVALVNYYAMGIGTTIFKPEKDKRYVLELENGVTHSIPVAENQGFLMHVNNLDANNAWIRITASSEVLKTGTTLIGTSGGIRYFENQLDFKDSNITDVELPKKDIPRGIFTLKLIDKFGSELARRPIWIDSEQLNIHITPVASSSNESIYKIKVTDESNSPVQAQLSLSVNVYEMDTEMALENYVIDRPNLFAFQETTEEDNVSSERTHRFLKDLSVLVSDTNFENISSNENEFGSDIKFPIQKGLELSGYAYDLDNNLLINTKIQIMAQTKDEVWLKEVETDANGLLTLEKMQISGSAKLIFRTKGKDIKTRLVKVIPLKEWEKEKNSTFPDITKNSEQERNNIITTSEPADSMSLKPFDAKPLEPVDTSRLIELEEVEVSENRVIRHKSTPSVYGIEVSPIRIKYQDLEQPKSIGRMLLGIPGVIVSGDLEFNPSVAIIQGWGPILWVLDGFPLPQRNSGQSLGSSVRIMDLVSATDIERIELLIGPDAAIFGSRGSGGVIAIYTRNGSELEYISRKQGQLDFQGYEPIIEFESYNQGLSKRKKEQANLLYWNPNIETDENGEAIIRFQASSQESAIKIEASTITPDGKIGSLRTKF